MICSRVQRILTYFAPFVSSRNYFRNSHKFELKHQLKPSQSFINTKYNKQHEIERKLYTTSIVPFHSMFTPKRGARHNFLSHNFPIFSSLTQWPVWHALRNSRIPTCVNCCINSRASRINCLWKAAIAKKDWRRARVRRNSNFQLASATGPKLDDDDPKRDPPKMTALPDGN